VRVGTNTLGGQVVSVLGPGLERHYYAHLDRFGSVREGDIVQPGDVLGYVDNSGVQTRMGRDVSGGTVRHGQVAARRVFLWIF
jgi:murein DD-endopeptidase MepM/ murein hydrolase activator NlpD